MRPGAHHWVGLPGCRPGPRERPSTFWSCRAPFQALLGGRSLEELARAQFEYCLSGTGELVQAATGSSARVALPCGGQLDILLLDPAVEIDKLLSYLLVADRTAVKSTKQFWFDVDRGVITSSVERLDYSPFMFLCRLASVVGDGSTVNALEVLARGHVDSRVRAEALRSLVALDGGDAQHHLSGALTDVDPHVRKVAIERLNAA